MNYSCHQSRSQSIRDEAAVTGLELEGTRTNTAGLRGGLLLTEALYLLQKDAGGGGNDPSRLLLPIARLLSVCLKTRGQL